MWSVQEDAVAEDRKACAAVHLALDQLCLVVDSFGAVVVVRQGEGGVDGAVTLLVDMG